MRYDLKKAELSDAAQLRTLWEATFRQAYAGVHSDADTNRYVAATHTLDAVKAALSTPHVDCIVAYRDGAPVGYVLTDATPNSQAAGNRPVELRQIYILQSEYGRGLGQRLLDTTLANARQCGHDRLWLSVSVKNKHAQQFYVKNDFCDIGEGPTFAVGAERLPSRRFERRL